MNTRTIKSAAGGLLVLGALVGVPSVAVAAPAGPTTTATVDAAAQPLSNRHDYDRGFRDGYSAGWNQAKHDCHGGATPYGHHHSHHGDYGRGFDKGFKAGYDAGHREYCRHR